jgi:hypothetical protein
VEGAMMGRKATNAIALLMKVSAAYNSVVGVVIVMHESCLFFSNDDRLLIIMVKRRLPMLIRLSHQNMPE